mmetsp:Transcript_16051/g.29417  ORF Transcript_16051/g.29417 Transcript_16051/m.29417 type:complete len:168 (+) Transcript_16051:1170-1673(+)
MEKPTISVEDTLRNRELWVKDLFYMHKRSSKMKSQMTLPQNTAILPQKYKHISKDYTTSHNPLRSRSKMLEAKQCSLPPHSRHASAKELRPASQCSNAPQRRIKSRRGSYLQASNKENSSTRRTESGITGLLYKLAAVEEYKRVEQTACKSGSFRLKMSLLRPKRAL